MHVAKQKKNFKPTTKFASAVGVMLCWALFSYSQPGPDALDGTTGIPLGGIGAGEIKFCSNNGTFFGVWQAPAALGTNNPVLGNAFIQFFSKKSGGTPVTSAKLTAVIGADGRADDDAVYPIQNANFGTINDVSVTMTAFCPWDLSNVDVMCYPYAFFQITLKNTGSVSVDAAVAFMGDLTAATTFVQGKGIKNEDGTLKRAIYVKSDDPQVVISAGTGTDAGFTSTGVCSNTLSGVTSKVAAKVTLDPGQTKVLKFVYAWNNDITGDEGEHDGMFYYLNKFPGSGGAGPVADTGLAHFDSFHDNAVNFVTVVRSSNLPAWIKNHLLMSLSNLTNNSMYRKDGRYAHTEGEWATNGTMDQMFHSRQIYAALIPSLNWQELQYWARTQKTTPIGQIHHDIDSLSDDEDVTHGQVSRNMAYMCPWDAKQHHDYRNIDDWVDLNCVYILSVYEAFIATADTVKLNYFWPSVKLAAQRLADQLATYNNSSTGFPYLYSASSQNTYDNEIGVDYSAYNNSVAIPTYKALSILAGIKGETTLQASYQKSFDSTAAEFKKYYVVRGAYPSKRKECILMGPWLCNYLKFGDMLDSASLMAIFNDVNAYYDPIDSGLGAPVLGTYLEWAEYKVGHFGGFSLQTGHYSEWQALQKDWYDRIYADKNMVYNIPLDLPKKPANTTLLATNFSTFNQYISVPVVWRLYYTIAGFQRNKYSQELWIEPIVPSTLTALNHTLKDVNVFSPEGTATINFTESGTGYKVQDMYFNPHTLIPVSYLYLKDRGLATNYVKINGETVDAAKITKIGTGFNRELKITYQQTVPASGITISVSDDPNFNTNYSSVRNFRGSELASTPVFSATSRSFSVVTVSSRPYAITIYKLNGSVMSRISGFGIAKYTFGKTQQQTGCRLFPGAYVARVDIGNCQFNRKFTLSR
jgi:uncharacterized protein (DUF608 family)